MSNLCSRCEWLHYIFVHPEKIGVEDKFRSFHVLKDLREGVEKKCHGCILLLNALIDGGAPIPPDELNPSYQYDYTYEMYPLRMTPSEDGSIILKYGSTVRTDQLSWFNETTGKGHKRMRFLTSCRYIG